MSPHDEPLVSVIMSTYGESVRPNGFGQTQLAGAIDSVREQRYPNWELILVADHPPRAYLDAIESLLAELGDARIRFFNTPERGGLEAIGLAPKQLAMQHVRADYIAFLDADNAWSADFLAHGMAALTAGARDLVYFDTHCFLSPDEVNPWLLPLGPFFGAPFDWHKPDWNEQTCAWLFESNFIDFSDVVLRRDAFEAAGGFIDVPQVDWHLWRTLIRAGRDRFHHVPVLGQRYNTSTLENHRRYLMLSLFTSLRIPYKMSEAVDRETWDRFYRQKHDA